MEIGLVKGCLLSTTFRYLALLLITEVLSKKAILLDTREALSDLGWTTSPGSEWQEMSSSDAEGNERRMLMVCKIKTPNQNNWMRTQYIPVHGARRIYVEVEFTIRSCEDVPNVATCKETFNLYYYETDRDEATSTFPPWREQPYIKVDTIAADRRFQPGSARTNFETRDIGPITKNGLYLAVQDTGACVALMHVRVFYKYCDKNTTNLATFARTTAGPEVTSLIEARGSCVRNAITENGMHPRLHCNAEGLWTVPSGTCVCTAGYEPNKALTQCYACKQGNYKSTVANKPCKRCPDYSLSRQNGSTLCDCMDGYFRALSDNADQQCTKPPSKPINLYSKVNQTSVTLNWGQPHNTGGRNDLTYRIECEKCDSRDFKRCVICSKTVQYSPSVSMLTATSVTVSALNSYSYYRFKVCASNGVTSVAKASGQLPSHCVAVKVETNQAAPSAVVGVQVTRVKENSFVVSWNPPASPNGQIQQYEVDVAASSLGKLSSLSPHFTNQTAQQSVTITGLKNDHRYIVKVRARTTAGYGPYSTSVSVNTLASSSNDPPSGKAENHETPEPAEETFGPIMMIAIGVGVLVVLLVIVVAVFLHRRNRKKAAAKKRDIEKQPAIFNGNNVQFHQGFASSHKTYIDPTTYEDPHRAVREFTKEIDTTYIKIEQVIGGGEFGEVCRGRLHLPGKPEQDIAIKTLKTGYSTQQKLDFLGEASIMGQFDHPNVIRLEGVATKSRPLMIITEYMENGSLDTFLRNHDNEFSVIQLVGMLRNIAAGMKYLSDMGYVHRDLAARNILVNAQLICKVSDFGMSRVLEEDSEAAYTTRGGKIPIRWTAPEAFTFRKFTSASDVWSYGIVMWEVMSYGERPYWGMSNRDVMNAVETGYRLPAPMDCPQVQHQLMLDCWKKDRNQRPKFGQIVASLDKMIRDPAQLKVKVSNERNRNAPTPNGTPIRPSSTIPNGPSGIDFPSKKLSSATSYAPIAPDSGINEDTDEDSPMLQSSKDDLKREESSVLAEMSSLGVWLDSVGLSFYKDNFTKSGCVSVDQILQLNSGDLARLGILDEHHQMTFLKSIQELSKSHHRRESGLPTYTESNMLHPGISV